MRQSKRRSLGLVLILCSLLVFASHLLGTRNGSYRRVHVEVEIVHSTKRHNDPSSIKSGEFVYLVLGMGHPPKKWVLRSVWENICVIYMSWKSNVTASVRSPSNGRLHIHYLPNSTWTTARNRLTQLALAVELEQGWKFEYLMFFDEDLSLLPAADRTECERQAGLCDDTALWLLTSAIIRDRPMQVAVKYPPQGSDAAAAAGDAGTDCISRCHVDHALLGLHRTALGVVLPYDAALDDTNWWSSAYVHNMLMAGIAPRLCSYYRHVLIDGAANDHRIYPRGVNVKPGAEFRLARLLGGRKLALAGVPGFHDADKSENAAQMAVWAGLNAESLNSSSSCYAFKAGVDFRQVLRRKSVLFAKARQVR